ncbi:MAG: DNA-formamidopyrimidine glycosylase [Minisyncoccia bacterium]
MPELPEVETIANDLKHRLIGWVIIGVWSDWPKYLAASGGLDKVKRAMAGRRIISIERRGKNIIFNLSGGYVLAAHLKMTGHFLLDPPANLGYIHLIFDLKKGNKKAKLYFSDVRKFGRVIAGPSEEVMARPEIKKLGPDPLKTTVKEFLTRISARRGRIKSALMNQEFLAGVGNIYSDEALYLAKIHPLSRTEKIPPQKLKLLFNKLVGVLKKSLKLRGTTRRDYRDLAGKKGGYFARRLVYARKGERCVCSGEVRTVRIGSRTAHFCHRCQVLY